MAIYIKAMEMPQGCGKCIASTSGACDVAQRHLGEYRWSGDKRPEWCPLMEVLSHGRLIDADALRQAMYHEAFETDSPMQKWDSGCWIRYKMFEQMEEAAPTIIPPEEVKP